MKYAPGDPAPIGVLERAAWTMVQTGAGLRQTHCPVCGFPKFPQELSKQLVTTSTRSPRGRVDVHLTHICKDCAIPRNLRARIIQQFTHSKNIVG